MEKASSAQSRTLFQIRRAVIPSKAAVALMVALLIPSLTACMQDVNSQLIEAGKEGETRNIEGLLASGADVDAKDEKGVTA